MRGKGKSSLCQGADIAESPRDLLCPNGTSHQGCNVTAMTVLSVQFLRIRTRIPSARRTWSNLSEVGDRTDAKSMEDRQRENLVS